jgi:hypothetical protein
MVGDPSRASYRIETFDTFRCVETACCDPFEHSLTIRAALVLKRFPRRLETFFADRPFTVHQCFADFVHRRPELTRDHCEPRIVFHGGPTL